MNQEDGVNFLKKKDPILGKAIDQIGPIKRTYQKEAPFIALASSIIYQQLAESAAKAIYERFQTLCNNKITPKKIQALSLEELKTAGLSERKASYLKDLARHFIGGLITPENFDKMSNEEITNELISVRGIGPWTAEMFLMFHLNKPDVFSAKDLGLHKGICKLYNKDYPLKEEELIKIAERWSPYRTLASFYLWKIKDNSEFESAFID